MTFRHIEFNNGLLYKSDSLFSTHEDLLGSTLWYPKSMVIHSLGDSTGY